VKLSWWVCYDLETRMFLPWKTSENLRAGWQSNRAGPRLPFPAKAELPHERKEAQLEFLKTGLRTSKSQSTRSIFVIFVIPPNSCDHITTSVHYGFQRPRQRGLPHSSRRRQVHRVASSEGLQDQCAQAANLEIGADRRDVPQAEYPGPGDDLWRQHGLD